jgi:hypothetical protein
MSSELDEFMVHAVTVRTRLGAGGMGTSWAAPATFTPPTGVFVDDKRRLVRGADAAQVVSEATLFDVDVDRASAYTPGTEVTLPSGRVATVITVAARTSGPLELPDHVEVTLT